MKSTYEKRWGHPRYRIATKHIEIKARKREEAENRQAEYNRNRLRYKTNKNHTGG